MKNIHKVYNIRENVIEELDSVIDDVSQKVQAMHYAASLLNNEDILRLNNSISLYIHKLRAIVRQITERYPKVPK